MSGEGYPGSPERKKDERYESFRRLFGDEHRMINTNEGFSWPE
jgi:hypothetical protein